MNRPKEPVRLDPLSNNPLISQPQKQRLIDDLTAHLLRVLVTEVRKQKFVAEEAELTLLKELVGNIISVTVHESLQQTPFLEADPISSKEIFDRAHTKLIQSPELTNMRIGAILQSPDSQSRVFQPGNILREYSDPEDSSDSDPLNPDNPNQAALHDPNEPAQQNPENRHGNPFG